jgi:hypothetical protein
VKVAYTDGTVREEPDPMCSRCDKVVVKWVLHYMDGAPDYCLCQDCLVIELQLVNSCYISRFDPNFILPLVDMTLGVDPR